MNASDLLDHVKSTDVLTYIRARGWSKVAGLRAKGDYEYYSPPQAADTGRVPRVAVPTTDDAEDLRDIAMRIASISAAIERRPVSEVISDMVSTMVGAIDVRILPRRGGNKIPLASAPRIYGSLNTLLSESAKAESKADAHVRQTASAATRTPPEYWLLPAVPRSFAFRIESIADAVTESLLGDRPAAPVAHKAVCRIVRGLQQSQRAVEQRGWDGIEHVLTARMCDALLDLHGAAEGGAIEFEHTLSPRYELPHGMSRAGTVRYTGQMAAKLTDLRRLFDVVRQSTAATTRVIGRVVELKNKVPLEERERQLTLAGLETPYEPKHNVVRIAVIGETGRTVTFSLREKAYREACAAHAAGSVVYVDGKLVKDDGKWTLSPVEAFGVAPMSQARTRAKRA